MRLGLVSLALWLFTSSFMPCGKCTPFLQPLPLIRLTAKARAQIDRVKIVAVGIQRTLSYEGLELLAKKNIDEISFLIANAEQILQKVYERAGEASWPCDFLGRQNLTLLFDNVSENCAKVVSLCVKIILEQMGSNKQIFDQLDFFLSDYFKITLV